MSANPPCLMLGIFFDTKNRSLTARGCNTDLKIGVALGVTAAVRFAGVEGFVSVEVNVKGIGRRRAASLRQIDLRFAAQNVGGVCVQEKL